jgi:hypothetical protein
MAIVATMLLIKLRHRNRRAVSGHACALSKKLPLESGCGLSHSGKDPAALQSPAIAQCGPERLRRTATSA